MADDPRVINLIIVNVRALEAGVAVKSSFDTSGGVIGSGAGVHWQLIDEKESIHGLHCEINFIDDAFCLKDLSGETYINASSMPLGKDSYARLADDDVIQIGEYEVRVFLDRDVELKSNGNSLEQLFPSKDSDLLDSIPTLSPDDELDGIDEMESLYADKEEPLNLDPLIALELEEEKPKEEDSLLEDIKENELDEEQEELLNHITQKSKGKPLTVTVQADSDTDISSAISFRSAKKNNVMRAIEEAPVVERAPFIGRINPDQQPSQSVKENNPMDDNILDLLEQEVAKNYAGQELPASNGAETDQQLDSQPIANNHVLGGPLMNGLGVDIGSRASIEEMQALSGEMGMTLQACIQGLLDLHSQVKGGRFDVMNRSLQPIEDNPLRLGLSYEDTVRVMFDEEKSIVHLSGAASVEESMNMIKIHNEAVQYATNMALEQILLALSPTVLLKRFSRYSRKSTPDATDEKAWAWEMYENYYQELTSNRQQGFEKLFWEIFEQSYDKKVREKHAE